MALKPGSFAGIRPGSGGKDGGVAVPIKETAKERLERVEKEYAENKEKEKLKQQQGPKLRWLPPVVEKLSPVENEVYQCVLNADKANDGDDNEVRGSPPPPPPPTRRTHHPGRSSCTC